MAGMKSDLVLPYQRSRGTHGFCMLAVRQQVIPAPCNSPALLARVNEVAAPNAEMHDTVLLYWHNGNINKYFCQTKCARRTWRIQDFISPKECGENHPSWTKLRAAARPPSPRQKSYQGWTNQ